MQLGIAHNEAAKKANNAGLKVVQGKCIKVEHSRYFGNSGQTVQFNIS